MGVESRTIEEGSYKGYHAFTSDKYKVVPFRGDWDPFDRTKNQLIEDLRGEVAHYKEKYKQSKLLIQAWENSDEDYIWKRCKTSHRADRQRRYISQMDEQIQDLKQALTYEENLNALLRRKIESLEKKQDKVGS